MSANVRRALSWLVTLLVPVVLVLGTVRAVLNPWFLEFEYRTPDFPPDQYGFSMQDRLKYARVAVEYLVNDAGIEFLGEERFPNGQQAPPESCIFMDDCTLMYNERELGHMVDVKNTVQAALRVWYGALLGLLVLGVWAWRGGWAQDFLLGLKRGGWLTVILLGVIILLALILFQRIFVTFHKIFFIEGTWTFLTSDTLIRLFPERFWRDTFLIVGGLPALMGLLLGLLVERNRRRPESL
ncbi:MAG: TIGR01906 family membrane protein [Chloroflexota bacterium]|nr:MAG: TIGR01906 family membrane protein [Chloroflexota bacterium]